MTEIVLQICAIIALISVTGMVVCGALYCACRLIFGACETITELRVCFPNIMRKKK